MRHILDCLNESLMIFEGTKEQVEAAKTEEGLHPEAGGKCGWFATADSCYGFLISNNSVAKSILKNYFTKFGMTLDQVRAVIDKGYEIVQMETGEKECDWLSAPFIFSAGAKMIAWHATSVYPYQSYLQTINDMMANKKLENHSGFGTAAKKGLKYEETVRDELINLVNLAIQYDGKLDINNLPQTGDLKIDTHNKMIVQHFYPMYEAGAFDEVISMCKADPTLDLTNIITLSGSSNTHRNSKKELCTDDFKIAPLMSKSDFMKSGEIISDITINSKNPIYISVKIESAQLSGIDAKLVFPKNFGEYLENLSWDEAKKDLQGLQNFADAFGLDPEEIYNDYKAGIQTDLTVSSNYDKHKIGELMQNIIGGNYWYIKPSSCIWIPGDQKPLSFEIESARFSNEKGNKGYIGKDIDIKGRLGDIPATFIFRTSDRNIKYPYRLFPKINLKQLHS